MRILYDYQIFSLQRYGGVSRYIFELIRRCARNPELEVDFYPLLHLSGYDLDSVASECRRFRGLRRPPVRYVNTALIALNRLLFRGLSGGGDIYHATYYHEDLDRGGSRGAPVLTAHDMIQELYPQYFPGDTTADRKARAVRAAAGVLAVSHQTKKDLVEILGVDPAKVRVVYHGNSLEAPVSGDDPPLCPEPYILYVGPRFEYKNFSALRDAYCESPMLRKEYRLLLFGGGPLSEADRAVLQRAGALERVTQLGGDDRMLARAYAGAAVFVYPSLYEGFGIPPLEAMRYDCPGVASRGGAIPEICGDAARYFDPRNPAEFRDVLYATLRDKKERERMTKTGLKRARDYQWKKHASELEEAIRKDRQV